MITIRFYDHILAAEPRETIEVEPGRPLAENLLSDAIVVVNGEGLSVEAALDLTTEPGDVVEIFPIHSGPAIGAVGGALATAGSAIAAAGSAAATFVAGNAVAANLLLFGVGVGLQFLTRDDLPDPGGLTDQPRKPPFDGPKTQIGVGQTIPIVFGETRVGGSIISQSFFDNFVFKESSFGVETPKVGRVERSGQGLQTLLMLALGEVDDVTAAKVDNIPVDDLPGVVWTSRRGEPAGNSPIKAQDDTRNEVIKNVLVRNDSGSEVVETDNPVDGLELLLSFPNGLWWSIATPSDISHRSSLETWVRITVRYRQKNAASWITLLNNVLYSDKVLHFAEIRVEFPELKRAVYEIEVTKNSSDKDVVGFSVSEGKTPVVLPATNGSDEMRIGSFVEINKDDRLYPGFSLGFVRQDAEEEIAEIPRTFSFLVKGFNDVRAYDSGLVNFTTSWTDNPAWLAAHFITRKELGLGKWFDYSNIDLASFFDWATFCDQQVDDGDGGTEKRCLFNHAYEVPTAVLEILDDIARAGNAFLYHRGSTWFAVPDRADSRVTIFTESHTLDDGPVYRWRRQDEVPTRINAEFLNGDRDFFRDSQPVPRPDVTLESEHHDASQTFWGVTRVSQIQRDALKLLRRQQLEDHEVEFTVSAIGRRLRIGQVFGMSMPTYGVGTASGRLLRVDDADTWVEIDGNVSLSAGPTWQMNVIHQDGTTSLATLQNVDSSTFRFEATDPADFALAEPGDDFTIGVVQDYRCLDMKITGDQKWTIIGAKYDAAVYGDAQLTPTQPAFSTAATATGPPPKAESINFRYDETGRVMSVEWTPPKGVTQVRYEVFQRSQGNEGWVFMGATTGTHLEYEYHADPAEAVDIAVVSISQSGARLDIADSASGSIALP